MFIELILDLIGVYFNFEIQYMKSLSSILLFFHHYIILQSYLIHY